MIRDLFALLGAVAFIIIAASSGLIIVNAVLSIVAALLVRHSVTAQEGLALIEDSFTEEENMKRPVRRYDEYDVVTPWRRWLCYLQRPGVTAAVKRRLRRRERHDARHRIRKGQ